MWKRNKSKETVSGKNDFAGHVKKLSEGLYYISETDAAILPFVGAKAQAVSKSEILRQTKSAVDAPVEERVFGEIFARLTKIQDWFGDEEKETAAKYIKLRDFLEKNLKDLKVFKVGSIQLKVYFVGLDSEGRLMGIKTEAVET
jgi:hypothetical protein